MRGIRRVIPVAFAVGAVALVADPATAHIGGLSGSVEDPSVPTWLTILTGGTVIGASFLFTSLITDHVAIRAVNEWRVALPTPRTLRVAAVWAVRITSVAVLGVILASAFVGPTTPIENFAVIAVWAAWWAGYTMTVYLVGNTWPLLNPWRTVAGLLPRVLHRPYPQRLGAWPAVVGLLGLVWIEVVSPVTEDPVLLGTLILAYTAVTLVGAAVYGVDDWFGVVDPISRVFRCYGRLAPVQRTDRGIELSLPVTPLTTGKPDATPGATAFVVALLWVTTYDGLVSTPTWAAAVRPFVGVGVPPTVLYLVSVLAGFALFFWGYRFASRKARETAGSYVAPTFIERWFIPSLLPIAAGYHFAHFLGYFLNLLPALLATAATPLGAPGAVSALGLPGWFGVVQLVSVLLGHVFAIWVAHSLAFELFPGVFKPIRSQYPFIGIMIFYTMTSMWVVVQPFTAPPYV